MQIKPLGNRILLKPIEAEEKTKSGLYIPDSAKEKPLTAKVIAVGSGELIKVKPGQKVIYESFGGSEIKIKGDKHLLIDIKDILAVVATLTGSVQCMPVPTPLIAVFNCPRLTASVDAIPSESVPMIPPASALLSSGGERLPSFPASTACDNSTA